MRSLNKKEIAKVIIDTLKPFGVERIAFFGSFSRGDEHSGSDIDVLVKLAPLGKRPNIGLRWFSLDQEIEKQIGRHVDLVSEDSLSELMKSLIEKDLDVIYEKAG